MILFKLDYEKYIIIYFSLENKLEFTKRDANNRDLPVFTVSSAEYLKISDKRYLYF